MNVFERMAQALEAANITVDRTNHLDVVARGCELIEQFNALGIEMVTEEPMVLGPSLTEPAAIEAKVVHEELKLPAGNSPRRTKRIAKK